MESAARDILIEATFFLLENLKVAPVMDRLFSEKIFSVEDYQQLLNCMTEYDKIRQLVLVLLRSGEKAFNAFITALNSSDQAHISENLSRGHKRCQDEASQDMSPSPKRLAVDDDFSTPESSLSPGKQSNGNIRRDLIGYIQQVLPKTKSRGRRFYLSFMVQIGEDSYIRCLTFCPDMHEDALHKYAEDKKAICLRGCYPYQSREFGIEESTLTINQFTEFLPATVAFPYRPKPFTRLGSIQGFDSKSFIDVKVFVVAEVQSEMKQVRGEWLEMQEKQVVDEDGVAMKLTAWEKACAGLKVKEEYKMYNVAVNEHNGYKSLGVSPHTFCVPAKEENVLV